LPDTPTNSGKTFLRPHFPDALRSFIPIGLVNEPISLYSGQIDFTQNGKTFRANGCIYLDWLPSPRIRFDVPRLPDDVFPAIDTDLSFRLNDGTEIKEARLTSAKDSFGLEGHHSSLSGLVAERVTRPFDGPVRYAMFLLPNLGRLFGRPLNYPDGSSRASRIVLQASGWTITLDAVDNSKEIEESLENGSGFGITNVGRLERDDGKLFTADEALTLLVALAWYTSFAAGGWTGPCLLTGSDAVDKQVWQVWDHSRTAPFRKRTSWLERQLHDQFEAPFPGFLKLWLEDDWEEVVRVAIHWYVESNAQAGSIEGSIILTQTAFELLASAVLVEHHGWLSTDGYEKLAAADRIRLLFLWAGIPVTIPARLVNLVRQGKAENWPDTATAMTMIRNTISHPTKKNREKFGKHLGSARTEAWVVGLWNLELCLLRLFGYRSTYANRITQKWAGEVELVPWAAPMNVQPELSKP
jgi:hypothetical protein